MTMRYMLDTDHVSYALRGQGNVAKEILTHRPADLCLSSISVAELRYGADRRGSRKLHRLIDAFTGGMQVLPFDEDAGREFGRLASKLASRGTPIGNFDALIAAHAISIGVTLATNNTKHFTKVRGLRVENWL